DSGIVKAVPRKSASLQKVSRRYNFAAQAGAAAQQMRTAALVADDALQRSPKRLFISQHIGAGKRYRAVMPTC
ncbi:hypothetical protein, partial [Xanthomonas hortorum]|uniref:hypothetical protein n=1 Tax=Xanthomonas hortorum TaxID=56454 RepID=UPI0019D33CEA